MVEPRARAGPVEQFFSDRAAAAGNDDRRREARAWAIAADTVHDAKKKVRELFD